MEMNKTVLDELLERVSKLAKTIKEDTQRDGDTFPGIMFVFTEDGEVFKLPMVYEGVEKELLKQFMPELLTRMKAKATCLAVDAFMAVLDKDADLKDMPPPSQHPDRQETLLVSVRSWGYQRTIIMPYDTVDNTINWKESTVSDDKDVQDSFTDGYFGQEVQH